MAKRRRRSQLGLPRKNSFQITTPFIPCESAKRLQKNLSKIAKCAIFVQCGRDEVTIGSNYCESSADKNKAQLFVTGAKNYYKNQYR